MEIGQADPLLATWQRGLGRATAWTSDATVRWLAQWVDWEGYSDFWGRVVRDVLPAGRDNPPVTFVEDGNFRFVTPRLAPISTPPPPPGCGPPMVRCASFRSPEFLNRNSQVRRRLGEAGAYWVAVTQANPDGSEITSGSGAVSAYEEEFAFREPDPTLGNDLAALTGGRLNPDPASIFDAAPQQGRAEVSIWPWLAALALALFLGDVALRRLVFTAGDADLWRTGMATAKTRERKRIETAQQEAAVSGEKPAVLSESETLQRLMRRKRQ